ncbi:hypothetical protein OTK49_02765 [Vibrio coralliirubri]|uniref:hypothetical protein n=1 Tax=Vibrio coralliirubri TaxID=1516159 RepID=UPI0022836BA0|nr:hypothetical protein [Vibrio coralliirubri]MCY9861440.1 hypothetical protein [Vibrio coralliirubri]
MRLITPAFALSVLTTSVAIATTPIESKLPLNSHYDEGSKVLSILGEQISVKKFEVIQHGFAYEAVSSGVTTSSTVTQNQSVVRKSIIEKRDGGAVVGQSEMEIELELFDGSNPTTTDELTMMTDNVKFEFAANLDFTDNVMVANDVESIGCGTEPKGEIKISGSADFTEQAKNVDEAWGALNESELSVTFTQQGVSTFAINLNSDETLVNVKIDHAPICKTINAEYMKGKDQGASAMALGMGGGMLAGAAPTLSQGVFEMMPFVAAIINNPNESTSYSLRIHKDVLKREVDAIIDGLSSSVKVTFAGESEHSSGFGSEAVLPTNKEEK